jgi:hypothetical protein
MNPCGDADGSGGGGSVAQYTHALAHLLEYTLLCEPACLLRYIPVVYTCSVYYCTMLHYTVLHYTTTHHSLYERGVGGGSVLSASNGTCTPIHGKPPHYTQPLFTLVHLISSKFMLAYLRGQNTSRLAGSALCVCACVRVMYGVCGRCVTYGVCGRCR